MIDAFVTLCINSSPTKNLDLQLRLPLIIFRDELTHIPNQTQVLGYRYGRLEYRPLRSVIFATILSCKGLIKQINWRIKNADYDVN